MTARVDNRLYPAKKLKSADTSSYEISTFKAVDRSYGVETLHRPSNVGALREIAADLPLIFRCTRAKY